MDLREIFWKASLEDLKLGYIEQEYEYLCLLCGKKVEKGIVYQEKDTHFEAERYMRIHIEKEHGSVFDFLINLDKKLTGLTEHQSNLLQLFYQGKSDEEIQKELEIGSTSTIRNHRYTLKQKERQSKVFLTMMELLEDKDKHAPTFLEIHSTATMVDDRYNITQKEKEDVLKKYFPDGLEGKLSTFYMKEKYKLIILQEIIKRFERDKIYKEIEINQVLKDVYDDFVTLRRYLIEYGFMDRKADGSEYWLK
ncbi:DUF2087 domain-containing protein [Natronospora cellulosivora (SeqCode)]